MGKYSQVFPRKLQSFWLRLMPIGLLLAAGFVNAQSGNV